MHVAEHDGGPFRQEVEQAAPAAAAKELWRSAAYVVAGHLRHQHACQWLRLLRMSHILLVCGVLW